MTASEAVLMDLLAQVRKFCEEQGEAEFETGAAEAMKRQIVGLQAEPHMLRQLAKVLAAYDVRSDAPAQHCNECETQTICTDFPAQRECGGASAAGWVETGMVCQACAGDAPDGKRRNERCVGGPIVRELVPVDGVEGRTE